MHLPPHMCLRHTCCARLHARQWRAGSRAGAPVETGHRQGLASRGVAPSLRLAPHTKVTPVLPGSQHRPRAASRRTFNPLVPRTKTKLHCHGAGACQGRPSAGAGAEEQLGEWAAGHTTVRRWPAAGVFTAINSPGRGSLCGALRRRDTSAAPPCRLPVSTAGVVSPAPGPPERRARALGRSPPLLPPLAAAASLRASAAAGVSGSVPVGRPPVTIQHDSCRHSIRMEKMDRADAEMAASSAFSRM